MPQTWSLLIHTLFMPGLVSQEEGKGLGEERFGGIKKGVKDGNERWDEWRKWGRWWGNVIIDRSRQRNTH